MKIIQALKNLKTIEKRIEKNCQAISLYCAYISVEVLPYETEDKQRQEVQSLVQANIDLEKEYLKLKCSIEYTNLITKVKIGEFEYSISELIVLKRGIGKVKGATFRANTYKSLSLLAANQRFNQAASRGVDATNPPRVIPLFQEKYRNEQLTAWENFLAQIDGTLEVVNAETEITNL